MWPLGPADFGEMTEKILAVYATAKGTVPSSGVLDSLQTKLKDSLARNQDMTARTWVRTVIDDLDKFHAAEPA